MATYKPRSKSELNKDARKYLNALLERELSDLNKAEIEFIEARRMYLTAEQLEHYGIKVPKMEKVAKGVAPKNEDDEDADTDENEDGEESDEDANDDEPNEDEEGPEDAPDGADLDPATGKVLKAPTSRAGGKKK